MTTVVNTANFQDEVLGSSDIVLVDFYADWCGPCQGMLPIVDEIAENSPAGTKIVKLNIDESPELAGEYGVMSIPTFKVFKEGAVVDEAMGGGKSKEELESLMTKHI